MVMLSCQFCGDFQPDIYTCSFTPLPFEDHPNMSDKPEKPAQEKQTSVPLTMIHI